MGRYKKTLIADEKNICAISEYFNRNNITFTNGDYKEALKNAAKGDFVYLDPPYNPISKSSSFTAYTKEGFGRIEEEQLKSEVDRLTDLGVNIMLFNSDTDFIRELYFNYKLEKVMATRCINTNGNSRNGTEEVIITNY